VIQLIILLGFNFPKLLAGKPSFTKKQADLFFPPDFADDFPVAMQVRELLVCGSFLLTVQIVDS
jgi:hypothetical protein